MRVLFIFITPLYQLFLLYAIEFADMLVFCIVQDITKSTMQNSECRMQN